MITLDFSPEYTYIHNLTLLTYYQIDANGNVSSSGSGSFDASFDSSFDVGSGTSLTCKGLKRMNKKNISFGDIGIEMANHYVNWVIYKATMSVVFEPKRGDYFTENGNTWEVQGVDFCVLNNSYRLYCDKEGY